MIAYNNDWLYNIYVRKQADEAFNERCITQEAYDAISAVRRIGFYTPNYFVRRGFAILTLIVVSFVMGLMATMFGVFNSSFSFFVVFFGVACYIGAELLVRSRNHYNSGVDNVLIWMAAGMICGGMTDNFGHGALSGIALSSICLVVCGGLALRFADVLLTIAATLAFFCVVFFCYEQAGALARNTTPFLMILVAGLIYFVSVKLASNRSFLLYRFCLRCVSILSLLAMFSSGNYYLVRELSNEMFNLGLRPQDPLPLGWFFWAWTFGVPFVYIGVGIFKKDIMLIRVGLPLIAVPILTFRYYHSIMSPETAMLLGGSVLFIVSYSLIRYLRIPRNGFAFKEQEPDNDIRIQKTIVEHLPLSGN